MEVLIMYLIFCATTSIASLILLLSPVLKILSKDEPLNLLVQNKFITYCTFFIMGILVAPILILSVIFPMYAVQFQSTLLDTLKTAK